MFGFKKKYSEQELVEKCQKGNRNAQQQLYSQHSDKMLAICLRYVGEFEAEDVLVNGFMKVFEKLNQFSGEGSLEGWIRRIMVNESLMHLRKNKKMQFSSDLESAEREMSGDLADAPLDAEELLQLVQSLPDGYRMVFNLYAIEGFSHKEIAKKLTISEGTSKSQLSKARAMLRKMLEQNDEMTHKKILMR
ncbi:MAG: RNA polymerase sigma factor (sigma-70 family) [Bacteroidia bacterium]